MTVTIWHGPDIAWDDQATLPDLARRRAAADPDAALLIDAQTGVIVTAAGLHTAACKAARGLAAAGFARGDTLCTLVGNDLSWYVAALAAQMLGGTISGINPLATPGEIARQFSQLPCRVILCWPQLVEPALRIAGNLGRVHVFCTAEGTGVPSLASLDGPDVQWPVTGAADAALLPFSSGSSGLPKAAIISHGNLVAAAAQAIERLDLKAGDRLLALAPLFHIVGPQLFATALLGGVELVVVPRFDPAAIISAMRRHHVTHMPLLTPVLRLLSRHPAAKAETWPALRVIAAGGAAMSLTDHAEASACFGCAVLQVYGMTETSSFLTVDHPGDAVAGTAGRPMALASLRIADMQTGVPLAAGEAGEVQFNAPTVFQDYLGMEEASRASFTADGFLKTGDIGFMDEDGRLHLQGRIKELIKVNSSQVAPAELEMLLAGHPAVAEAAVLGRPNRYVGEAPVAWLVLSEPADPFTILDWVNEQVSPFKRLRGIELAEALPKNATGKIDRAALAALDRQRLDRAHAAPSITPVASAPPVAAQPSL